ncbi:transcription factor MYB59 [Salvia miltiorrhiza]|uniref:MYB-related transcription factor n=1 Tax=Salvia miltiorrhiza TaxID=226208 RepID=A0A059PRJ4_SALMI|nr:transcription factor MYB59 [Salvia miltiorrhiza]AGN52065.1 MYB-related transcription factor [Salvia miltiorrhiza]AGN52175.1 MYB-related transcription factor [Salvia miltiorrhiza]
MMEKEDSTMRKGPWTEEEDAQLVFYVNLFGDRRWDFIAKVSGLKRTGKSCRLRWVNYLHPGLKRGKMTPHEERLVLQLHSKWGNRWSRIARKIPGRTDNEIKNYWRTHMRKKAQDQKKKSIAQSSSSSSSSSSTKGPSFYDTGGDNKSKTGAEEVYSMDEIWKDIELCEESSSFTPLAWDFPTDDSLWAVDEEEPKMLIAHQYDSFPFDNHMTG